MSKGIFYYAFCRVQNTTCTICRERHLKKKMALQTSRSCIGKIMIKVNSKDVGATSLESF